MSKVKSKEKVSEGATALRSAINEMAKLKIASNADAIKVDKVVKKRKARKAKTVEINCQQVSSQSPPIELDPVISSNEFFYNYDLGDVERTAQEAKAKFERTNFAKVDTRTKSESEKADSKKQNKRELRKLKTPSNQMPGNQRNLSESSAENTAVLLERLKLLQTGKLSSIQNNRSNPLPSPKKIMKEEEITRNKNEVHRLNEQIQQKIARQIKPKLRQILNVSNVPNGFVQDKTLNGLRTTTYQHAEPNVKTTIHQQTRCVPIEKTLVQLSDEESVEIYRYTKDDLYQLQSLATFEIVPRLNDFKISSTHLEDMDLLLLKLLQTDNIETRQSLIIQAAEKRKLITKNGSTDFSFRTMMKLEPTQSKIPKTLQTPIKSIDVITLKTSGKSNEEINEIAFQHEFNHLFADVLKDQNMTNQTITEAVKYLLDNNQAQIIEGEIRVNSKNCQEAYVSNSKSARDVCINKLILRKHSFQGDCVKVLVKCQEVAAVDDDLDSSIQSEPALTNRSFGCVLEVLEKRHSRRVIGFLSLGNNQKLKKNLVFNVRDTRVPNVRIHQDVIPKESEITKKTLMIAEITSWCHDQPIGRIVQIIGEKGQLKVENEAILLQHNLSPQPFAQNIIDQLPSEPFTIPAEEFIYRQDLRKSCIFSIDPETARDLDDALSCEVLSNGNLLIGVHISDVSYFLKENSELDIIVKDRATSIYLVDRVYHMLPESLCMLCSLLPGADKMAYSVFWEMNSETAEIIDTKFTRSVIKSCAKLSYEHAQLVIENENNDWSNLEGQFPQIHNGFTIDDVANVIVKLQKLAIILRNNRKANGAIKIDQPKISFRFDKDDQRMEAPVDFFQYVQKDSNRLIEEFMLLANISVGKFIYEKFPKISLLRHHDPPNDGSLKKLTNTLSKHGIAFDSTSSSSISASMESLVASANGGPGMNAILNMMVSKTMSRARYFCSDIATEKEEFWHYALSIPIYTHFTSPIRRYADVLVHRVLNAALGYEPEPTCSSEEVQKMANVCNAQKYLAKLAGDDSVNLYFMQFLQSLQSKTFVAGVLGIYDYNLEVVLVETGNVLKVYYKNLQQTDEIIIKPFVDQSPPYVVVSWPKRHAMKIKFGSEIIVKVEVSKDKLIATKMCFSQQ